MHGGGKALRPRIPAERQPASEQKASLKLALELVMAVIAHGCSLRIIILSERDGTGMQRIRADEGAHQDVGMLR